MKKKLNRLQLNKKAFFTEHIKVSPELRKRKAGAKKREIEKEKSKLSANWLQNKPLSQNLHSGIFY